MKTHFTQTICAFALFSFFVPAAALAQTLTIDPGSVVGPGDKVSITFEDNSLAGQTIVVVISNGEPFPNTEIEEVFIVLDGNGKGTESWPANPAWDWATFNAGNAPEESIIIGDAPMPISESQMPISEEALSRCVVVARRPTLLQFS